MTTLDDILARLPDNTAGDISAQDMRDSFTDTFGEIDLKAPIASPTFTGTVSGVTKSMVGLGNADNTSDVSKPISTAQQTALDLKAPLASPTFTGTVGGITKSMVGLGNVDNTTDAAKPVSTAQATADNLRMLISTYDSDTDGVVSAANQLRRTVYFQGSVAKGDPVYVTGVNGADIQVNKAASSSFSTLPAVGLAVAANAGGSTGEIIAYGALSGMDTGSWSIGDALYVASAGGLTNVRPTNSQFVGFVLRAGGGDGVVGTSPQSVDYGRVVVLTDAATIAVNAALSDRFRVTLGASRTLGNPTNARDGQMILFEIIEDGTGGWAITLDTKFNDPNGYFAGMTTTASKRSKLGVQYNLSADKFDVLSFATGY